MSDTRTFNVKCLFCHQPLEREKGKDIEHGELVKCSDCGELNDLDSAVEVTKEEAVTAVKNEFRRMVADSLKGLKGFKLK
ncbi:hypothetical protein HGT70_14410 [Rosenbergiella collisarenosi]|uniref:hypothetical protein n=1 Tax=Rosenbergiella collisarenosi TaxID=1544695 RepID=UPI001BDB2D4C|nr:hypothetical protein [Rosenbergiella collisarenosi]MBT0722467.1 hypothetical protein [Rosenbergiella collisarenosi]